MENTYFVNFDDDYQIASSERMSYYPTLNISSLEEGAIVGIMNNCGSNSIIKIKEVSINELTARNTTAIIRINLQYINDSNGGDEVLITSFDSLYSISSQVKAYKYPVSVTTYGAIIRSKLGLGTLTPTSIVGILGARGKSTFTNGLNLNHVISSYDSDVQPLTLREGEGIYLSTGLVAGPTYPLELTIHMFDGTNTFCINEVVMIRSDRQLFSLINNTGSGVVLNISRIELRSIRTGDNKSFYLMSCSDISNGTPLNVIPLDSAAPALDSDIKIFSNCSVVREGSDSPRGRNAKMGGDRTPYRRLTATSLGISAALAGITLNPSRIHKVFKHDNINDSGDIVLNEGEGICIMQRDNLSGWGRYGFSILMNVIDNNSAPSGGGEYSYVF